MARILVVDDDQQIADLIEIALSRMGHDVVSARGGREALVAARRNPPDLVLLDFVMPDMNGDEVLAEMRSDPDLAGLPVVLATGEADSVGDLEVFAVLAKPYKLDDLYSVVADAVGGAQGPATA